MITVILAGITIEATDDRAVYKMSDWTAWPALIEAGFFTDEWTGTGMYRQPACKLTDAAIEAGTPKAPASAMLARCQAQPDLYR